MKGTKGIHDAWDVNVRGVGKYRNRVIESTNFVSSPDKRMGEIYAQLYAFTWKMEFQLHVRYEISIRQNPFGSPLFAVIIIAG